MVRNGVHPFLESINHIKEKKRNVRQIFNLVQSLSSYDLSSLNLNVYHHCIWTTNKWFPHWGKYRCVGDKLKDNWQTGCIPINQPLHHERQINSILRDQKFKKERIFLFNQPIATCALKQSNFSGPKIKKLTNYFHQSLQLLQLERQGIWF